MQAHKNSVSLIDGLSSTIEKGTAMANKTFTTVEAEQIGNKLGVDWVQIDLEEFRLGLGLEAGNNLSEHQTDSTEANDILQIGKKVWEHLKQTPNYYSVLMAMEAEANANKGIKESGTVED